MSRHGPQGHKINDRAVDRVTNPTSKGSGSFFSKAPCGAWIEADQWSPEVQDEIDAHDATCITCYLLGVREDLRGAGRRISLSGLRRLYRRWLARDESERVDQDFGGYALSYADPVGETATEHVLRQEMSAMAVFA